MKNILKHSKSILFIVAVLALSLRTNAQVPIPTQTIIANQTYGNHMIIPAGNVVTVNPGVILTFDSTLTIDSGATLIVNNATIRMGNNQRILLMQPQWGDSVNHGGTN